MNIIYVPKNHSDMYFDIIWKPLINILTSKYKFLLIDNIEEIRNKYNNSKNKLIILNQMALVPTREIFDLNCKLIFHQGDIYKQHVPNGDSRKHPENRRRNAIFTQDKITILIGPVYIKNFIENEWNIKLKNYIETPIEVSYCFYKKDYKLTLNKKPINKILILPSYNSHYPSRIFYKNLNNKFIDSINITDNSSNSVSSQYFLDQIYNYKCCYIGCIFPKLEYKLNEGAALILRKIYEVALQGSLILCDPIIIEIMKKLFNFEENKHYMTITKDNYQQKINYICSDNNDIHINNMRKLALEHIKNNFMEDKWEKSVEYLVQRINKL